MLGNGLSLLLVLGRVCLTKEVVDNLPIDKSTAAMVERSLRMLVMVLREALPSYL